MERLQEDWQHEYRATPMEYPISSNEAHSTYDQFIQLRDTLIYSNKYYADSAGRSLIIWTKLNWDPTWTIEIREPNISKMSFEPGYENDVTKIWDETKWTYLTARSEHSNNKLSCDIKKSGRYKLQHKEQFIDLDSTSITRITAYIMQHQKHVTVENNQEIVTYTDIPRAVFDWEWDEAGFFKRVTSFGYVECDLAAWDWLEFIMEDQNQTHISSDYIQTNSDWRSAEYIDLPYNS